MFNWSCRRIEKENRAEKILENIMAEFSKLTTDSNL